MEKSQFPRETEQLNEVLFDEDFSVDDLEERLEFAEWCEFCNPIFCAPVKPTE